MSFFYRSRWVIFDLTLQEKAAYCKPMNAIQFISKKMRLWFGNYSDAARTMGITPRQFRMARGEKKPTTPTTKHLVSEYKYRFLQRFLSELRKNGGLHDCQIQGALKRMNRKKV